MTTVTLTRQKSDIVAVSAEGHSGYAEAGRDIVCAAVSAAMQLAECQLADQLGVKLDTKIDEPDAVIRLKIVSQDDIAKSQPALLALAQVIKSWAAQYPENLNLQEADLSC